MRSLEEEQRRFLLQFAPAVKALDRDYFAGCRTIHASRPRIELQSFTAASPAQSAARQACKRGGLVEFSDGMWFLTPQGIEAVKAIKSY